MRKSNQRIQSVNEIKSREDYNLLNDVEDKIINQHIISFGWTFAGISLSILLILISKL